MMPPLRFAQMLCSRLCHDLIAPIGAINSGMELLQEEALADNAELLQVVRGSSQTVAKRLVFYRAVFGFSSAVQFKGLQDVARFIQDYMTTTKVSLIWSLLEEPSSLDMSETQIDYPNWGRALANLTLLLCEAAPRGGTLTIQFSSKSPAILPRLILEGPLVPLKIGVERTLWDLLPEEEISPHEVQAYLTRQLLEELGVEIERLEVAPERICLTLKKRASGLRSLFAKSGTSSE
jgi:histidine phosphotransferase ChpT